MAGMGGCDGCDLRIDPRPARGIRARRRQIEAEFHAGFEKPYLDADAYDVAGRRG